MKEAKVICEGTCYLTGVSAKVTYKDRPNGYNYRLFLRSKYSEEWTFYRGFDDENDAKIAYSIIVYNKGAGNAKVPIGATV